MTRDTKLLEFCTERQAEVLQAVWKHGSNQKAAKALGINRRVVDKTVQAIKHKAARQGYSPDHHMVRTAPPGFLVKGTSTYYNDEGQPVGQWVKTTQDREAMQQAMEEAIAAMGETIPREKPKPAPKTADADLLNLYTITDYHFGMLAWGEETGADWDLAIAESALVAWFEAAMRQSPDSEHAVLAQLGDFLHFDSLDPITPTSRHLVDADSRFTKIVRCAIRVFRRVVNMLLAKHKQVHLLMAEGNHDITSSMWLREWFAVLYEDEPRITVERSPDPYYCFEHGQTSLFFHHGHKRKVGDIDHVLAAKFRDVFGRTKHSYCHMGHLHHEDVKETSLMIVEQHPTLAASDAHASRGGWMSRRAAKVITYHRDHGEVSRSTVGWGMVAPCASSAA